MNTPDEQSPDDLQSAPLLPRTTTGVDPLIGVVLASRYRIERKLGRGATGAVYRATHVKFGRAFAVKILAGERAADPKLVRRFAREAELSAQLQHPHVVSVIDVGETEDGARFMVQELAMGIDLSTIIDDDAPLEGARTIGILRGVLDGLYHAHEQGLIHRDLKPENVIVERDDHFAEFPRIVDFGIAIARDEAAEPESPERLTTTGLVLGTPQYMAPEQGMGYALDHRIDLFAVGVIAYEMLAGVLPFEGTGAEVARANVLEPTPAMAVRKPGVVVDPLLEAFTARLMAKEPDARPATAHAARELLDLIERDRPAAAALLGVPLDIANRGAVPIGVSRRAATAPVVSPRPPPSWTMVTPPAGLPIPPLPVQMPEATAPLPSRPPPLVDARDRNETDRVREQAHARRRPMIVAMAFGCALAAGGLALVARSMLGGHHQAAPPDAAAIVVALIPVDAGAPPPVDAAPPATTTEPGDADPADADTGPATTAVDAGVKHLTPRPLPLPPPPGGAPSATDVAKLYTEVGRALAAASKTHTPDELEALQLRFRRLRLADAISTEAARGTAGTELAAIRHELAAIAKLHQRMADDPNDPLLGLVLASRYRIDARLGNGATGAVYRASHVKFGRQFAVKVLVDPDADPKVARRFEREAELGGKVRHPNVISVVDVGETGDGTRYMVMELAIGMDLATVLQDEAPLTGSRTLHLLRGLCEGLDHAHERGVIHRDFKPENIIIERDDHGTEVPRIVDFGIAIAREEASEPESPDRLTTMGLVLGTPHYMAPEQATASAMDHRIDLFALGVVAYEMLSGVMPFDGTGAEVARANMTRPTPPMVQRAPAVRVDPLLEAFTARLMAKEPDARPPTAKAARELLDLIETDRAAAAALLGLPVEAAEQPVVPVGGARRAETVPDPVLLAKRAGQPPPTWLTPSGGSAVVDPAERAAKRQSGGSPRADTTVGPAPAPTPVPAPVVVAAPPAPIVELRVRPPAESEPIAPTSSGNRTRLAIALVVALVVVIGGVMIATRPPQREAIAPKRDAAIVVTMLPIDAAPPPIDAPEVVVAPPPPIDAPEVVVRPPPDAAVEIAVHPVPVDAAVAVAPPPPPPPDAAVAAPPPTTPTPTATEIAALYTDVGHGIKDLSERKGAAAADDLWARYRLIRLSDALASDDARRTAAATLGAIRRDLTSRH